MEKLKTFIRYLQNIDIMKDIVDPMLACTAFIILMTVLIIAIKLLIFIATNL